MNKYLFFRKLILISIFTVSALLINGCQAKNTSTKNTTLSGTNSSNTEQNTSITIDEYTTTNSELSSEITGDLSTEGTDNETTNIYDTETSDNSNEANTDSIVETTTQKPTETTTQKPAEPPTQKPTEPPTQKPTEPPTPSFLEQIALTESEKAEGFQLISRIVYGKKTYQKYRMEKIGGKDILTYMTVGLQYDDGSHYIAQNPTREYILDTGQRVVATRISGVSLGYFIYKPGQEGHVPILWEEPGMSLSHYYSGASMFVYTPWRYSSTEGPMVYDPNGEFLDKETYLEYMSLYGNAVPDSLSLLDPSFVWTYDEISIEYDFVYDFYMFIETHLKGTEYENVFIEYGKTMTTDGLYCGRYEVLTEGEYYNFFREMQKKNQ